MTVEQVKTSVIQDAEVARHNLILQHGTGWNVDSISMIGYDDYRSLQEVRGGWWLQKDCRISRNVLF